MAATFGRQAYIKKAPAGECRGSERRRVDRYEVGRRFGLIQLGRVAVTGLIGVPIRILGTARSGPLSEEIVSTGNGGLLYGVLKVAFHMDGPGEVLSILVGAAIVGIGSIIPGTEKAGVGQSSGILASKVYLPPASAIGVNKGVIAYLSLILGGIERDAIRDGLRVNGGGSGPRVDKPREKGGIWENDEDRVDLSRAARRVVAIEDIITQGIAITGSLRNEGDPYIAFLFYHYI